jgi:hypothetical protein
LVPGREGFDGRGMQHAYEIREMIQNFGPDNLMERDNSEDLIVDGKI